jgi:hypothetical protein
MSSATTGNLMGGEPMTSDDWLYHLPVLPEMACSQLGKLAKDPAITGIDLRKFFARKFPSTSSSGSKRKINPRVTH